MKRYVFAAAFGFAFLVVASIWMGGLNQDEGWYLYAANLVTDGKRPFADFFYTQGPLMPIVYSAFTGIWNSWGLVGARVFTALMGLFATIFFAATAAVTVPKSRRTAAVTAVSLLLGVNLYHLYYTAIPKTYALASLFVAVGFWLVVSGRRRITLFAAGAALAFAAGTRISLGALLAVAGFWLLVQFKNRRWDFLWFGIGGVLALALVYGPFVVDEASRNGLVAAQRYHAARGGFDPVFVIGSISRLVRWYLPVFIVLGLGVGAAVRGRRGGRIPSEALLLLIAFAAVFAVQILAPFPYEDYQVPVMGLLAAGSVALLFGAGGDEAFDGRRLLLVFGLCYATSFGSPLLEKWTIAGQDRFWSVKKEKSELGQLREVAKRIEAMDPGGKMLLTQDTYLAVETGRKVPKGLEMGPFSMLADEEWKTLLKKAPSECPIAALSGYTFAIDPPVCSERPLEKQLEYWSLVKEGYELVFKEEGFGQNATPLMVLKRK